MEQTREAGGLWMTQMQRPAGSYLFPSRQHDSPHFSTRQYGRIVKRRSALFGGDPQAYGTHSPLRTKATLICQRTRNLRAVQILLGHRSLESTVRYRAFRWMTPWRS
jgi:site-specific recombinase XerD